MQLLSEKTKTWTMMRMRHSSSPSLLEEEGEGGGRGINGGGMTVAAKGAAAGALLSPATPAAPLSGPDLGKVAAGAAGDSHCNSAPPGRPSRIHGPKPGGRAAAPVGNDNTAAATVAGKADNVGQENDNRGGDNGGDNEDNNKWWRGA